MYNNIVKAVISITGFRFIWSEIHKCRYEFQYILMCKYVNTHMHVKLTKWYSIKIHTNLKNWQKMAGANGIDTVFTVHLFQHN